MVTTVYMEDGAAESIVVPDIEYLWDELTEGQE